MIIFAQVDRERYDSLLGLLGCAFRDGMSHYHHVAIAACCVAEQRFLRTERVQ